MKLTVDDLQKIRGPVIVTIHKYNSRLPKWENRLKSMGEKPFENSMDFKFSRTGSDGITIAVWGKGNELLFCLNSKFRFKIGDVFHLDFENLLIETDVMMWI